MTAKPATCASCSDKLTRATRSTENPAICNDCFEEAGLENDHNDNGHPEPVAGCPACGDGIHTPDAEPAKPSQATGRKNFDHSACQHDVTKAARAKCRRATAKLMADIAALHAHD